jgi:hypothetical protein
MDTKRRIDAAEALDTLFQIVREEALSNSKFARRLLDAVGYTVEFRGEEALAALDPVLVAMRGPEEFRRTFLSMPAKDLKKIGKDFNLIESHETAKKTVPQLVDLLWERASERMRDLVPPARQAAE